MPGAIGKPEARNGLSVRGKRRFSVWRTLSLVQKFSAICAMVLMLGSLIIATWVSRKIEHGVTQNTAVATALYMESFVAPITQELASTDRLSASSVKALERLFKDTPLGERVVSFKIWKTGGLIVHAADRSIIGRRFGETENLRRALAGEVVAGFDDLGDAEDAAERSRGIPLLEIYSPIREAYTGRVIAVAEFYERAGILEADLSAARRESWIVVGLVMGTTALLLFGLVAGGGQTIQRQRETLERRVRDLANLADQNRILRTRVESAAGRAAEMNERYLKRLSADLHDGPTQMLALAALRLDELDRDGSGGDAARVIRDSVKAAMQEIRHLCRGLAMPELEGCTIGEIIGLATDGHRRRTGSSVALALDLPDIALSHPQRICIYRFIQEGLSNAYRHACGIGQAVGAAVDGDILRISVTDDGPGMPDGALAEPQAGLGLRGLKDRIESLGGTLCVDNPLRGGAMLEMTLYLSAGQTE